VTALVILAGEARAGGQIPSPGRLSVFTSEAWTHSGAVAVAVAVAAASPATSAAAGRVFAPIAASVACAAVRSAGASRHQPSVASAVDGPAPVSAGVSVVPDPASRLDFPAVAHISCLALGSRCWK
jgi:hypothetical protein